MCGNCRKLQHNTLKHFKILDFINIVSDQVIFVIIFVYSCLLDSQMVLCGTIILLCLTIKVICHIVDLGGLIMNIAHI